METAQIRSENRDVRGFVAYSRSGQRYLLEPKVSESMWILHKYEDKSIDKLQSNGLRIDADYIDDTIEEIDLIKIEDGGDGINKHTRSMLMVRR